MHFEGWGSRYDETFKFNSLKINFFRKYSEGYTGQKKNALRKFQINYTTQDEYMKRVKNLVESRFQNQMSAQELTQFVRGKLYFHLDSLLSLSNSTCEDDLP